MTGAVIQNKDSSVVETMDFFEGFDGNGELLDYVLRSPISLMGFTDFHGLTGKFQPTSCAANEVRSMEASSIAIWAQLVAALEYPKPVLPVVRVEDALIVKHEDKLGFFLAGFRGHLRR